MAALGQCQGQGAFAAGCPPREQHGSPVDDHAGRLERHHSPLQTQEGQRHAAQEPDGTLEGGRGMQIKRNLPTVANQVTGNAGDVMEAVSGPINLHQRPIVDQFVECRRHGAQIQCDAPLDLGLFGRPKAGAGKRRGESEPKGAIVKTQPDILLLNQYSDAYGTRYRKVGQAVQDFWYYGLRLRTDVPLTGFPCWPGVIEGPPDIVLRQGEVPKRLEAPIWQNARLSLDQTGTVLAAYPGLFRVLALAGGREARIALLSTSAVSLIRIEAYLLANIAGVLLHQRAVLPLHASSIVIDGRAVVLVGNSGLGKSTLASAALRAGYRLLSDDITVIRLGKDGAPWALAGSPHLRLQDDAITATGVDPSGVSIGHIHDNKKIWRRQADDLSPASVAAVFRLGIAATPDAEPTIERLNGLDAIVPLSDMIYRARLSRKLGHITALAQTCLHLAEVAPFYRLTRSNRLDRLNETLALIRQTL